MTEVLKQTTDQLAIELAELKLREAEGYLSEERKTEIRRKIGYISFELQERAKSGEEVNTDNNT